MADITIVNPSQQVQTVATSGQQGQPPAAPSLPAGTVLAGTIVGKDAGGSFLLRTPQGTVTLQSATPLTYNSDVVVRLDAGGASSGTARILSVNGEAFADFSAPLAQEGDSVSPALLAQVPDAQTNAPQVSIRATVITAPPVQAGVTDFTQTPTATQATPTSTQPAPEPLAQGTTVVLRVAQALQTTTTQQVATATTPQPVRTDTGPTSSSVQAQTQAQDISANQTPANVAKLVSPQPAILQQNTPSPASATPVPATAAIPAPPAPAPVVATAPVAALYAAYKQPAATETAPVPAPATAANTAPITVPAQVTTASNNGVVTLQTPLGAVTVQAEALPTPSPLTSGAAVSIDIPPPSTLSIILTPQSLTSAPLSELAANWQTLNEIVNTVNTANPPVASALLARLPQLGTNFIASATAFVGALAQGDTRKLLGEDTVETLRQNGRTDLLEKFSGEVQSLAQAYTPATDQKLPGWQTLFLPFVYQEELQQARLYVKRDAPKKTTDGKKTTADTRFIVEVDMSELGPMQMDGLVRKQPKSTAFDLVVRSRLAFSKEQQADILAIYNSAAELTGFKGSLAFQVTHDFPVKPLEEIAAAAPHVITA